MQLLECPRGGKVAAQDRAVRQATSATSSPSPTERDLGARCAPAARREPRRSRGRLRLRPAAARRTAAGTNREGTYWRYEMKLRDAESRLGSITGGNGSIYAAQARRLRRGRPALGPRPLVPVPDGAGGQARRLRAAGARLREADAVERDRVPAQGADVRALLGDHAARLDVPPAAARLPRRDRLAPAAPLRQRDPAPDAARLERRPRRRRLGVRDRARRPGGADRARRPPACRSRGTTRSSPGRRSWRSGTTCGVACRRRGRLRREPGEPRPRCPSAPPSGSPSRARCSPRPRSRSRSRTAAPSSSARPASARTARTSSCSSSARWSSTPSTRAPATPSTRATAGSRGSAGSFAARRSTSCRSSGTSCAAR